MLRNHRRVVKGDVPSAHTLEPDRLYQVTFRFAPAVNPGDYRRRDQTRKRILPEGTWARYVGPSSTHPGAFEFLATTEWMGGRKQEFVQLQRSEVESYLDMPEDLSDFRILPVPQAEDDDAGDDEDGVVDLPDPMADEDDDVLPIPELVDDEDEMVAPTRLSGPGAPQQALAPTHLSAPRPAPASVGASQPPPGGAPGSGSPARTPGSRMPPGR